MDSLLRKQSLPIILICLATSVAFCHKLFPDLTYLGAKCWDQFVFWNAVPRLTILEFHQFPLWNPYVNGGNVLLAHPHASFLSPVYILVMIFGPIVGLKLQIVLHFFIGLMGMYSLGRFFSFSKTASFVQGLIYMGSSIYFLHMAEGHLSWLAMAFVPWLTYCYLRSLENKIYLLGGILSLSLMCLSGSVDVLSTFLVLMPLLACLLVLQRKTIRPIIYLIAIYAGSFLLCAIKLLPMLEFITKYPRWASSDDCVTGHVFIRMILDRQQAYYYSLSKVALSNIFGTTYRWHEYGSYVGAIPLVFMLSGVFLGLKKQWPFLIVALLSFLICLGNCSPANIWSLVHSMPFYDNLKVHSRFIVGVVFFLSLPAGLAFSRLEDHCRREKQRFLLWFGPTLITLFILFDLWQVNSPLLDEAAVIAPFKVESKHEFAQRYREVNFYRGLDSRSSLYRTLQGNSGVVEGFEVMGVDKGDIRIVSDAGYKGEAYFSRHGGRVSVENFSPNNIKVRFETAEPDVLILNQNYGAGWRVKTADGIFPARNTNNLISFPVKNAGRVTFFYLPSSFIFGSLISALTIMALAILGGRHIKKGRRSGLERKMSYAG